MTDTVYTPGPWTVDFEAYQGPYVVGNGRAVAAIVHSYRKHLTLEEEGNAALIASAPALLDACKLALPKGVATDNRNIPDEQIIPLDFTMGELRQISAAIAKAEGRAL